MPASKLIALRSLETDPFTPLEFTKALNQPDRIAANLWVIRELLDKPAFEMKENIKIGAPAKENGHTDIHHLRLGVETGFAVPLALPNALRHDVPLPRRDALELASNFGVAYAIVRSGINRAVKFGDTTLKGLTARASFDPEFWPPTTQLAEGVAEKLALPYRAAGLVALEATQIDQPLVINGLEAPYSLPIAGLVNPLAKTEFHDLRASVLK